MTAALAATLPGAVEHFVAMMEELGPLLRAAKEPAPAGGPAISHVQFEELLSALRPKLAAFIAEGDLGGLWRAVGIGRSELSHCSVLGWLLDPLGGHGLGASVLRAFLASAGRGIPGWDLTDLGLDHVRVTPEHRPLGSERDRVDIAIEGRGFIIFVEVKIDAAEGERQLERYLETAEEVARLRGGAASRWLVVFLSPRPPSIESANLTHVTWSDAATAIDEAARSAPSQSAAVVRSFARHVRSFR